MPRAMASPLPRCPTTTALTCRSTVPEALHYRHVDVSSFNELARRFAPSLYLPAPDPKPHRALEDVRASIEMGRRWITALRRAV